MQSIERLRRSVHEWLVEHELDGDTAFYTPEEWRAREEPYLADSALVLVFEGELYRVMNGHHADCSKLYDEFEQFVRGFGYFFELGHAWNMGFYPLTARRLDSGLRIYSDHDGGTRITE
jgi:hypothetical protein